jgi:AAA domain
VINAPAGSGKSTVLTLAGRESWNLARFFGHLPGRPGARGPVQAWPGDLVAVDEASKLSTRDLADIVTLADQSGAKVIMAGDTAQLQWPPITPGDGNCRAGSART